MYLQLLFVLVYYSYSKDKIHVCHFRLLTYLSVGMLVQIIGDNVDGQDLLRLWIHSFISSAQTTFLKGRNLVDQAVVVNEV